MTWLVINATLDGDGFDLLGIKLNVFAFTNFIEGGPASAMNATAALPFFACALLGCATLS
jgi:hypothetical protein